jgi:hypothetical protein
MDLLLSWGRHVLGSTQEPPFEAIHSAGCTKPM